MNKRNLYRKNISVEEARGGYLEAFDFKREVEMIDPRKALGRVTAEPVTALRNSPLFDSSAMDGIAVIAERTLAADENNPVELARGDDYMVVDTGDPISAPYDAVIMAEEIHELSEDAVEIRAAATPWQDVRPVGEDIVKGEMVLPGSHKIRPMDIGVLLAGGITEIAVFKQPKVAVLPTGTEIISPGVEPSKGQIIDSNSSMLESLAIKDGCIVDRLAPVADDYELIKKTVAEAICDHDMVLVIAGSSAGTEDYTVHILRELGEVITHGVAMKPGKPVILSKVEGKPIVGVPGYPVSAYLAYENFVSPVLARLTGGRTHKKDEVTAIITRRLVSSLKYKEYVRVKVGLVDGKLIATPLARGAGAAMSLVRADGFCIIDQDSEGAEEGSEVTVKLMRPLYELSSTVISIGSHDLILDIIDDLMLCSDSGASMSSTHVGSLGGLMALSRGEAHIAPIHILDEASGEYNIPSVKQLFKTEKMALIKGVGRTQGIMVKKGNPLGVKGLSDLKDVRFINRQRGSGTRILFDYLLKREGTSVDEITGYEREATTHMAVAVAVQNENTDAGLGIYSAAHAMDLDFIPIADEEYDFAIPVKFLEYPHVQKFIKALSSDEFKKELAELGGYTFERSGEVIELE